ncbi:hypothetical protein [Pseudomonas donghuensis]|uniref:hypothetical protein n=1 Tax=Pseudomonas donghuensis TaxID=1163398 RepID=UPI000C2B40C4|nr:hypothetical protein [Pseudomonas donghuensis]PJY94679.1 hypothetical protein COO64_20225 [Pseudomonas donghuensis]WKY29630.1 hypothetical protein QYF67_06420 [Pseudomonas donghuensis]
MRTLADMALCRARGRINSVQSRASAKAPAKITPASAINTSAKWVVDGPINHFMFLEGRNWAIDLVGSLRGSPAEVVIERLIGAAVDRPGSYVAGIKSVITELQGADATDLHDSQNLTCQAGRKE